MDTPVLYSFRRCPYAMRARMAIYVSNQQVTLREIVLRDKPDHMLEISPKGTVPVLQLQDGKVVDESLDVMLWALSKNDPEGWLEAENGSKEDMLALIKATETDFKPHLDRFKYSTRYEDVDPAEHQKLARDFLGLLNDRLANGRSLFGEKRALADYAIMPFVRQYVNADRAWREETIHPHTLRWLDEMLEEEPFTRIMQKFQQWKPEDTVTLFPDNSL